MYDWRCMAKVSVRVLTPKYMHTHTHIYLHSIKQPQTDTHSISIFGRFRKKRSFISLIFPRIATDGSEWIETFQWIGYGKGKYIEYIVIELNRKEWKRANEIYKIQTEHFVVFFNIHIHFNCHYSVDERATTIVKCVYISKYRRFPSHISNISI